MSFGVAEKYIRGGVWQTGQGGHCRSDTRECRGQGRNDCKRIGNMGKLAKSPKGNGRLGQ